MAHNKPLGKVGYDRGAQGKSPRGAQFGDQVKKLGKKEGPPRGQGTPTRGAIWALNGETFGPRLGLPLGPPARQT